MVKESEPPSSGGSEHCMEFYLMNGDIAQKSDSLENPNYEHFSIYGS